MNDPHWDEAKPLKWLLAILATSVALAGCPSPLPNDATYSAPQPTETPTATEVPTPSATPTGTP